MELLMTDDRESALAYLDWEAEESNKTIFQAEREDDEYFDGSY